MFCGEGKQASAFHTKEMQSWRWNGQLCEAKCLDCKANNIKTRTKLTCSRCSECLPQAYFAAEALKAVLAENRMHELCCVKCAQEAELSRWWKLDASTCTLSAEERQRKAFAAVDMKLSYKAARECEACKYPACVRCNKQPEDLREYKTWSTADRSSSKAKTRAGRTFSHLSRAHRVHFQSAMRATQLDDHNEEKLIQFTRYLNGFATNASDSDVRRVGVVPVISRGCAGRKALLRRGCAGRQAIYCTSSYHK